MARHDVGKAEADKPSLDFLQDATDARAIGTGRFLSAPICCPGASPLPGRCRSLRRMFDHFDANDGRSLNYVETLGQAAR